MSLYTDIQDGVFTWTNRPKLIAETDLAIKQALRAAHRAGSWYRDLVLRPASVALGTTQTYAITFASDFRALCYIKPTDYDLFYKPVNILDVMDPDGYFLTNVYYLVGTNIVVRADNPVSDWEICYYKQPTVSPIASIDSWIADKHQDLIILWAAATILASIGEVDIKSRVDELAKVELASLIEENTESSRR